MINRLRGVPLFAGLGDRELELLAPCLIARTFGKGVFIYHKDSPGRLVYIVESGRVRLFILSDTGQEISIDIIGPGEVFGQLAVLDGSLRATGAVAMEPTAVLTLSRDDLLRLLDACPPLARNLSISLGTALRHAIQSIEDLSFLDVNGRVAARLLEMIKRYGPEDSSKIEMRLTQGELASWVGASRESVNKVLATMRAKGLVAVDGSRIVVLDKRGLQREVVY
jgi:CRP-like cAMP-binding protein